MANSETSPWWHPLRHADRRAFLTVRARLAAALRAFFTAENFIEVEPTALQVSPGNEAHLHAFTTELVTPDGRRMPLYLHTSPEFACKKLLAAGERRIVAFAPVYRNRERGPLHHPAFTMVEWYRAEEPYESVMGDCAAILRVAAETAGTKRVSFRGRTCDPHAEPHRITVVEAFDGFAGIDLAATLDGAHADRDGLAAAARAAGLRVAPDDTWSDIFSKVLVERVEPRLGNDRPSILCEYPSVEAALARPKGDDPRFAERFELYVCGVELANGFGELTDPAEQNRRFVLEMEEKARVHGESYPIDQDFLAALAAMPEASGVALGFDRLVMLVAGAQHIEQVIWTPIPQPG